MLVHAIPRYCSAAARALHFAAGLALTIGPIPGTHAARPMVTDDARIVDAKACQLESWVRKNRDSNEYWALPACNFTGKLELTLGGARANDAAGTQTTDVVLQGKTVFKSLEPNGWAWGLVVGNVRKPPVHPDGNLIGDLYAYVPTSFSFKDDRVVLHTNLGWLREKDEARRQHRLTWGMGSEIQLAERTWMIAEAFGQNEGRPFYQVGIRQWLVPNHVQVDATYGNRFGHRSDERWFSIGLRLLSAPFLP